MTIPDVLTLSCTKCGAVKAETQFDRNKLATHRNGRHQWCRECRSESWRARYRRDPEAMRADVAKRARKWRYGIPDDQYQQMVAARNGRCDICGQPDSLGRALCVDHDHACCTNGKTCGNCVRGLLCNPCNRLLGIARDNPDLLKRAIAYLEG